MNKTSIEWTKLLGPEDGFTWNPVRARLRLARGFECDCPCDLCRDLGPHCGKRPCDVRTGTFCTRISPGCQNCYASAINIRFGTGEEYTVPNLEKHEFFLDERILGAPVRRQKPATIFVGDMFDLFHESIPSEFIAEVLRVALKTPRHTFQFLTKRAERMQRLVDAAQRHWGVMFGSHMWFGVSVESQKYADERIPLLESTPAAVRFLSVEPLLEEVWIEPELMGQTSCGRPNWVICGGESGPGARPFKIEWAESLLKQCRNADVPFFMKQIGSDPVYRGVHISGPRGKGGEIDTWPAQIRVREWPERKAVAA